MEIYQKFEKFLILLGSGSMQIFWSLFFKNSLIKEVHTIREISSSAQIFFDLRKYFPETGKQDFLKVQE